MEVSTKARVWSPFQIQNSCSPRTSTNATKAVTTNALSPLDSVALAFSKLFLFDQGQVHAQGGYGTKNACKLGIGCHVSKSNGAVAITLKQWQGHHRCNLCQSS